MLINLRMWWWIPYRNDANSLPTCIYTLCKLVLLLLPLSSGVLFLHPWNLGACWDLLWTLIEHGLGLQRRSVLPLALLEVTPASQRLSTD